MQIHRVYAVLMRGFRRRRMRRFVDEFAPDRRTRILDVGGSAWNWELAGIVAPVVLLNLTPPRGGAPPSHFQHVVASGTALPLRDGDVDIAFSNSVIEHVGGWEEQWRFAAQMRRVGRALWVQTPARWFPFEPHLLTPFVHYLPRALQRRLLRYGSVWGWLARPSREAVDRFVDGTRLLTFGEMQRLFPDCVVRRERFLGLTKAYVAVRRDTGQGSR